MSESIDFVTVGEKQYPVIKKGRAQAEQALAFSRWLSAYGSPIFAKFSEGQDIESGGDGIAFIGKILDSLTPDALIDLFAVLIGCSKDESEENFDVAVLIDVLIETYNRQPAVRRIIERFFSPSNLKDTTEESSTTSE